MAVDWYLKIGQKEVGPLAPSQLKAMADRGQLAPEDPVRRGAEGRWVPAARVRGLFGDPAAPAARPAPADPFPLEFRSPQPPPSDPGPDPGSSASGFEFQRPPPAEPPEAGQPPADLPVAEPIDPATVAGQEIPVATPVLADGAPGPGAPGPPAGFPQTGSPSGAPGLSFAAPGGQPHPGPFPGNRPSAAGVTPAAARIYEAARRRRRQNLIYAMVATVLVTAGVAIGGWWLATTPTGDAPADAPPAGPAAPKRPTTKVPEVEIPEVDELLGRGGGSPSGSPAAATAEPPGLAEGEASDGAPEPSDVIVRVTGAEIGRPLLTRGGRVRLQPPEGEEYLTVRLAVSNRSPDKTISYTSWAANPAGVALVDDRGRSYPMKRFRTATVLGRQVEASIGPAASIDEVLVFEKPDEGAGSLRLELPSTALGRPGTVRLEIPASMIQRPEAFRAGGAAVARAAGGDAAEVPETPQEEDVPPGAPLPIPGLDSPDEVAEEAEPVSGFDDDPELMRQREELRRRQAHQRRGRPVAGTSRRRD